MNDSVLVCQRSARTCRHNNLTEEVPAPFEGFLLLRSLLLVGNLEGRLDINLLHSKIDDKINLILLAYGFAVFLAEMLNDTDINIVAPV